MDFDILKEKFSVKEARQLNPVTLAFIGDAAYEIFVRAYLVDKNRQMSVHKLHIEAISFVKAHCQSEFMKRIEEMLNEEEMSIFKRGRNAKSSTVPKNADVQEYRMATGFEALLGFLYLTEQNDRLNHFLNAIISFRQDIS